MPKTTTYRLTLRAPTGATSPGPSMPSQHFSAIQSIAGLCLGPTELPLYLEAAAMYSTHSERYVKEAILNLRRVILDHVEAYGWPVTITINKELS